MNLKAGPRDRLSFVPKQIGNNDEYFMPDLSQQLEMLTARALSLSVEAQEEIARGCHNKHEALVKCFINSGLTPGQVYPHLGETENGQPKGRSQGWFSKFLSGDALLNPAWDEESRLMRLCGNLIPLRYDALRAAHELKPIQTNTEARIKELEAELADRDRAIKYLGEMLRGGK